MFEITLISNQIMNGYTIRITDYLCDPWIHQKLPHSWPFWWQTARRRRGWAFRALEFYTTLGIKPCHLTEIPHKPPFSIEAFENSRSTRPLVAIPPPSTGRGAYLPCAPPSESLAIWKSAPSPWRLLVCTIQDFFLDWPPGENNRLQWVKTTPSHIPNG